MIRNNKEVGKVGFVASSFDLLHAGHIKMLEDAKKQCDYLIADMLMRLLYMKQKMIYIIYFGI